MNIENSPLAAPLDYDHGAGTVRRRVFADRAVYRMELATMFDRAWLFVGPASWLARPGAYMTSRMGDQPVIAWRGGDGLMRVGINRCLKSNELLTANARAESSVVRCPCHGVAYACDGIDGAHRPEPVPHVVVYRGLVFANRDPAAPSFDTWLGTFGWYLDLFLPAGGVEAYGGDSLRWTMEANWKLPVIAGCADPFDGAVPAEDIDGAQISLGGGAVALRAAQWDGGDDPRDGFAPLAGVLFPNLMFDRDRHSLDIVHPIGPTRCEMHSYCLVDVAASPETREAARRRFQFLSGPAGVKHGPQARLWQSVTAGARSGRHRDQLLSLQMGMGHELRSNMPGTVAPLVSEANQRAFFSWWQHQLQLPARAERRFMRLW